MQENVSLQPFNTFGVEAKARYFTEVHTPEELKAAVNFSSSHSLKTLLLGGGSNILLTGDFNGLAIRLDLKGISEQPDGDNHILVTAQAGENWHQFVMYCLEKNYGGLENLALIPGNVGTCPIQNIGAYGTEIKDVFVRCRVLNLSSMETENFDLEKCRFGYRDSIFKQEGKEKYIILNVTFRLTTKHHSIKTEYGAIRSELNSAGIADPTIRDVAQAVITIRKSKLPDPKETGNAGSFFKNPTIPLPQFEELQMRFPNIQGYPNGDSVKVPAGWLIEQCGWKGKQIGNVASHPLQALVIINATGKATGREIFDFSTLIIDSVREKFGIELEREVNII
ncbi:MULTISPECIES: UDP-N-acetylmuramate dehydrogenase [Chryseobacterium]|uniref:UDP-N-acetylenolpyruvoylglucosamine reductase n=1 Tax=Chryseobacterium camelliae TaxID=1265445 RepID=A0ABU0TK49_9FLAO|nr:MULTISPECIES: UDP-N-acetylmuramate dehydrogenase [Chryseobacterium]MDT3408739.1 UDP-N-acetylmuramate dehydrogenase [Pseudacidovorax intermedius]MDQ1097407.1 UDP-N-acetylmuramate dehydrogenase [Chryseobacterium camelliae]MDQ1101337.1 UDP-N-acetylmuramate dehydrogenase [Chryseobacterium sp. SORGH_AS_1048]MDR6084782.1 UDP-N-acetylmuramate dehydrogenase [Chryseobacterium sp. SORGH_AS_0909]MDR6129129.1 UDP-N-acetylmuramate dehydrogenase [Chryseobacterium sp. SORGH_AS_1175]